MGQVVALESLLAGQRVWRGQPSALPRARHPTGHAELDAALPEGGWPEAALTELLLPADGVGELRLLLPTLARLTGAGRPVVLVAPPYLPFPVAWRQAGVELAHLHVVDAPPRDALWATEQCLRSGSAGAVLAWPAGSTGAQADDRALRRLQVAADSGRALGFVFRDLRALVNPSPAALRLSIQGTPPRLRVVKCRGGMPSARDFGLPGAD
jgi:hypothetical protein